MMTTLLLKVLEDIGLATLFVNKRFSHRSAQIGQASLKKVLQIPPFLLRVARGTRSADIAIYFVTNRPASAVVDALAMTILRCRRVRVISYVHTSGWQQMASRGIFWRSIVRSLLAYSAKVVTLGPSLSPDVSTFAAESVVEIPNALDVPGTTALGERIEARTGEETRRVLFLSNLDPDKGSQRFIELASKLSPRSPVVWDLVGAETSPGQAAKLTAAANRSGANVRVLGPLYGDDKWEALTSSHLLVFPSTYRFEAQPLVLIEAMSAGLPVVAFNVGGVSDLVIDGQTGFLVEPLDIARFEQCVSQLLHDDVLRDRMGRSGRERFVQQHTKCAFAQQWKSALTSLREQL